MPNIVPNANALGWNDPFRPRHGGLAGGIRGVSAKKLVAWIGQTIKEIRPAQRVKPRVEGNLGPQGIGLQLELF